jgi:DNA-binding beta-propeller fold protein YncE
VALDASGNVYVADGANSRVQKFTGSGTYLAQWAMHGVGFVYPTGIAVDASGNIFVAGGAVRSMVQEFSSDGAFVVEWGTLGSGVGEFAGPFGLDLDDRGSVYVADTDNHRVQQFGFPPVPTRNATWGRIKALFR